MLKKKGVKVQPFKCGPDYIDTKFHAEVCGRPSVNLDSFMASPEHIRELFARYGEDADVCVVEGMMGLFDGYDRDKGSSAEIARILDIPVVLVVDAKSAAYSMAPLLFGFTHFASHYSPSTPHASPLNIAGVIFNKVGSEKHFQMLQQVCDDLDIKCFGYLPKRATLEQDSRYLGLDFSKSAESEELVTLLEQHINCKEMLRHAVSRAETDGFLGGNQCFPRRKPMVSPMVSNALVAFNDESFSFVYQETLDRFGSVHYFDPEREVPDFEGIDLLYLPGGYPEKHVEALVKNEGCRKAIKAFAEQGGRVHAECGGMMYLCEKILTDDPQQPGAMREWPMCGVLPYQISARQQDRKLSLGYRRFVLDGKEYRGHEFHYTQLVNQGSPLISAAQVYNAKGEPVDTPVFKYKNVLASYTHLYKI